jgi:tetratricopeptide (TPR) repeat protein
MRIGEILIGSSLINKEQLDEALNYAGFKHVPVGRALRVLRYLSEDDLSRAVDAQKAMRKGLEAKIALDVLKNAKAAGRTFNFALENSALTIAVVPRVLIESILDKKLPRSLQQQLDALQTQRGLVKRPPLPTPDPILSNAMPGQKPAVPNQSAAAGAAAGTANSPAQPPTPNPKTTLTKTSSLSAMAAQAAAAQQPFNPDLFLSPPVVPAFNAKAPNKGDFEFGIEKLTGPAPVPGSITDYQDALDRADKHFHANEVAEAEKAYKKALEYAEIGYKPTNIATALTKLANFYLSTDKLTEAGPLYERSLQIALKVYGTGSPKLTRAQEDLAELYYMQGRLDDARRVTDEALKNLRHEDSLDTQTAGRLLKRLMSISWRSGEATGGGRIGELAVDAFLITREQMQQALQSSKQTGSPLGSVLKTMGLLDANQVESLMFAQLLMKQSTLPHTVAVQALRLAVTHQVPLRSLCDSAKFITDSQRNNDEYRALVAEQEKLLAAESRFGSDHPEVARCAEQLADMQRQRKDEKAAELLYKRAIGILERYTSVDKNSLASLYEKMANQFIQNNRHVEAQPLLFRSLELRKISGSAESEAAANTLWQLAQIELAQYNAVTALSFLRTARSIFEKLSQGSTPRLVLEQIASCCLETGTLADLEPVLEQLITQARVEDRANTAEIAEYMEWLGDIYLASGKHDLAVAQYALSLEIQKQLGKHAKAEVLAKKLAQSA